MSLDNISNFVGGSCAVACQLAAVAAAFFKLNCSQTSLEWRALDGSDVDEFTVLRCL